MVLGLSYDLNVFQKLIRSPLKVCILLRFPTQKDAFCPHTSSAKSLLNLYVNGNIMFKHCVSHFVIIPTRRGIEKVKIVRYKIMEDQSNACIRQIGFFKIDF